MNVERLKRPDALWLLAAGCVLLVAFAWASWTVVAKYRQASSQLAEIGPRHARLAGMLQNKELFTESGSALKANLAQFVYPVADDASQTGNAALQKVRDLASARGLRVASSQAAAAREEQGFDRIGLNLRVDGEWPQLVAFLRDLAEQKPLLHQTSLQLGSSFRGPRAGESVFAILELYVLKERKP